jgi:uncharacterized membrane protein YfcA
MWVFLPVAGVTVNCWLLVAAGASVGFLSGLLGVGGGFLLTPILIMIGIPPTVAAASDSCQIVAASSSAVAAHIRLGNVDFRMGAIQLVGGLAGAAAGVQLIHVLKALGNADLAINLSFVLLLSVTGGFTMVDSVRNLRGSGIVMISSRPRQTLGIARELPFQMDFSRSGIRCSFLAPFLLCAGIGLLTTIMGVGGGFILVPAMVYVLGMPMHVAVGTSLFQILFTCSGVTFMQATTNRNVDVVLALLLAAGSTVGAQAGARVSRKLRGSQLMILLALLALLAAVNIALGLVRTPTNLLSPIAE